MIAEAPPLLEGVAAGAVTPQEGLDAPTDQPTWVVDRAAIVDVLRELKENPKHQFDLLLDICGVDYPDRAPEIGRFEAVYHLYSMPRGERLRLKVRLPESDPTLPTAIPVHKGADWFEREAYDLFGFQFTGHPNLRRILTHEGFQGHALRKDYDPARRWILTEDQVYKPNLQTRIPETGDEDMFERMRINLGPSHPAMHGTFRLIADLDGETIVATDLEIGYLHRCSRRWRRPTAGSR